MKQVSSRHIFLKCPFEQKRKNRDLKEVKKVTALMTELGIEKNVCINCFINKLKRID